MLRQVLCAFSLPHSFPCFVHVLKETRLKPIQPLEKLYPRNFGTRIARILVGKTDVFSPKTSNDGI